MSARPAGAAARALLLALRGYRLLLSPWLGSGCRFSPTCSLYAMEAVGRHGAAAGSYLAARRLLHCHPGCTGGADPVPERVPGRLFAFAAAPAARGEAAPGAPLPPSKITP
jgi:putative membrane protein insertion efficiency factor